ncbi:hypothetical protein AAFF_G00064300 [Aldrovandia affinis]|uniref:AKNA domain-containing protein n=1 Tax=Aldrovandia affinis TaxID=143900 RepID=A0AAD7WYG6_9TELE|nr:hypothetical protein AAFF_G00064300 [Aldrovandia affinis]
MAGGQRCATDSGRPSSASSGGSAVSWEGGEEDFHSQMDENGIIGLDQAAEEGVWRGAGEEGERSPISHQDPLEGQSLHLSDLQDSQSPGEDSHALSLYDLDKQGSDSWVSEEDEGSWLIHRLPKRDRQLDMTEDEKDERDEEEEEEALRRTGESLSESLYPGAVGPRDRQHRTEVPDLRQGEEGEVSPAEHCHGDHRGEEGEVSPAEHCHGDHRGEEGEVSAVERCHGDHTGEVRAAERCHGDHRGGDAAVARIGRDPQGEGHEGGPPGDTLTAWPSSLPLRPALSAGTPEPSLGGSATSPGLPRWTASPGFKSRVERRCSPRSHGPTGGPLSESEPEGSWDRRAVTPVSHSLWPREELAQGNGEEEEEEQEEEQEEEEEQEQEQQPWKGAARSHPTSPLQRAAQLTNRHPPSVVSPPPSDPAPYIRRRGAAAGGSLKQGSPARCMQDSGRYGKGQLSYPLPDFSKVEPKVRFPKGGYKPPKSRGCPRRRGPAGERPLVFKSPADIVREVLGSSADAPSLSPAPVGPPRPLNATVPREFRSPQQASVLVHQLQEDYHRLLTKYAEAENTIDRLRLEAKVGLYSDPPEPSHPDHTGTLPTGSKVMTLTFPQAQRAELDRSAARPEPDMGGSPTVPSAAANASSCSPPLGPRFGEQLTEALSGQAGRFHMQVDSFEELLRAGRLTPFEQLKGLSCLAQGQGLLEKGYLGAREEHRLLQQQGRDTGPFDPHREVEGEIFRSGMRLDELKEQVQPAAQVLPDATAPPSPPLGLEPTAWPSGASAPSSRPESPLFPTGGEGGMFTAVAVSSASGESDGEHEVEGDKRPSPPPWAQCHRQQHGEGDLSHLPYHSPYFGGPPGPLDLGRREGLTHQAAACSPPPGADGIAAGPGRTAADEDRLTPEEGALTSLPGHSQQEPLPRSPSFPWRQDQDVSRGGVESRSGSPTSVGERATSQGRPSKPRAALAERAPPQDGIVSPATDSGFVGSESSHLNLTAPSPAQQGATESPPSSLEVGGENTPPISAQPRPGSAPLGTTLQDHSRVVPGNPEVPPSGGKSRLAPPSSPGLWPSCSSGTSELGPQSDRSLSASEGEGEDRSVRHTQSANRCRAPAPAELHRYGDPFRVRGSGQPTDRRKAIQSLQADMSRLKEQLEGCLRRREPSCPVTALPLVPEDPLHSQHFTAPYSRFPRYQEDERREDREVEEEEETEEEEEEEEVEGRKTCNKSSPPAPHLRAQLDITSDAEYSQTTSKSQPSKRPYTGQRYSLPVSAGHDEVEQRERRSHARPDHAPNNADGNSRSERHHCAFSDQRLTGSPPAGTGPSHSSSFSSGERAIGAPPPPILHPVHPARVRAAPGTRPDQAFQRTGPQAPPHRLAGQRAPPAGRTEVCSWQPHPLLCWAVYPWCSVCQSAHQCCTTPPPSPRPPLLTHSPCTCHWTGEGRSALARPHPPSGPAVPQQLSVPRHRGSPTHEDVIAAHGPLALHQPPPPGGAVALVDPH